MLGLKLISFAFFSAHCLAYPGLSNRETPLYTSLGCYVDDGNPRVLPDNLLGDNKMTPQLCATHCAGYAYFGLEYGRECWCGTSIPNHPTSESSCSFPCAGDVSYTCGAGKLMNVYMAIPVSTSTTSKTSTSLHSPSTVAIPAALVTAPPVCHGDNCLNELRDIRFSASASAFCRSYTAIVNKNLAAIPTYLENCQSSPEYVSSACTCLLFTPSSTVSSTSAGSSHSINSASHTPTSSSFSSSKTGSSTSSSSSKASYSSTRTSSSSTRTSSSSTRTSFSSTRTSFSSTRTSSSSSKTSSSSSNTSSSSSSFSSSKTSSSSLTAVSTSTTSPSCVPTAFIIQITESGTSLDGAYLDIIGSTSSVDVFTWINDPSSATQFVLIDVQTYSNVLGVNSGPYQGYTMGSNDFGGESYSIDPWPSVSLNLPVQCTFPNQQYSGTMSCKQLSGTQFYVWTEPLGSSIFLDDVPGFPVVPCTMVAVPVC